MTTKQTDNRELIMSQSQLTAIKLSLVLQLERWVDYLTSKVSGQTLASDRLHEGPHPPGVEPQYQTRINTLAMKTLILYQSTKNRVYAFAVGDRRSPSEYFWDSCQFIWGSLRRHCFLVHYAQRTKPIFREAFQDVCRYACQTKVYNCSIQLYGFVYSKYSQLKDRFNPSISQTEFIKQPYLQSSSNSSLEFWEPCEAKVPNQKLSQVRSNRSVDIGQRGCVKQNPLTEESQIGGVEGNSRHIVQCRKRSLSQNESHSEPSL